MAGIDGRIVVIGLPTIAKQLHAGAEEVVWISQAYMLTSAVSLLLIGRIADLFGRVKLYTIGFIVFTVGSAICSLSFNSYQLIGFRILQGVGAAMLTTNSSAIVTDASPKKDLGLMLGINQTAWRAGNMAALTLSGLILSVMDWRGLFYVNIPIGIFGTIWARKKLREIATKDPSKKMDWPGFGLFLTGLLLILLAITYLSYGISGYTEGIAFLITGSVLLVVFIRIESKTSFPLLDLRLFKIRLFAAGNLAQILNSLAFAGIIFLVAFYLQIGLGYSPLRAGLSIIPLDVTYLVSSLVCGKLSDRYGSRILTTLGLSINTICFLTMTTFGQDTQYVEIALILAAMGWGNGMFTPPNLKAIMSSVPANRVGVASGFRNTMFQIGSTTSYGLIILFITFGIPYNAFSMLLQGSLPQSLISVAKQEFFNGFRIAALILAVIDAIAILPSVMRGAKETQREQSEAVPSRGTI